VHRLLLVICLTAGCRSLFGLDDPSLSDASFTGDGGPSVTIGGNVTGLTGSGLILQNNGHDDRFISTAGAFTFATPIANGATYNVTVLVQPTNPSETCTVTNGTGTATRDVNDINVTCMPASFTVGGSVAGFTPGGSIIVTNNAVDDKTITAGGAFTFATPVRSGQPFDVEIKSQQSETCSIVANLGTVGSGPVTTVVVICGANLYAVAGVPPQGGVTGLNGSVKLRNNGSDTITVASNGSFAFPTPLTGGGSNPYNVTVTEQPSFPPAAQACTVTNGSGTVGTSNISNVKVACVTKTFTVGGKVTGLNGGAVVLQQSGGETTTITASGDFVFATPVPSGNTYAVKVTAQPSGRACTVTNGSGTVQNSNITSVAVTCV